GVSASATDAVLAPNLTMTKTGNGTVNSTDAVKFTIVVSNTGAGAAYNVSLSDPLPDSAHLAWTTDGGSISGGTLSDAIGTLAAGASVTVHVSSAAPAGYGATLANTATAAAGNNSPGGVSASATHTVQAPKLAISKTTTTPLVSS